MTTAPTLHHELEHLRPALVRFAVLQLRNDALAEDVVQDALIAVLEKPNSFAGQSSLRTYVTAILKHKIVDALRATRRECQIETTDEQSEADPSTRCSSPTATPWRCRAIGAIPTRRCSKRIFSASWRSVSNVCPQGRRAPS
jgi:RNA polymerase sigma factor (sigma-70 family)